MAGPKKETIIKEEYNLKNINTTINNIHNNLIVVHQEVDKLIKSNNSISKRLDQLAIANKDRKEELHKEILTKKDAIITSIEKLVDLGSTKNEALLKKIDSNNAIFKKEIVELIDKMASALEKHLK